MMNICSTCRVLTTSVGGHGRVLSTALTAHKRRNVSASAVRGDECSINCRTLQTACVPLSWASNQALYPQQTTRSFSTAVVCSKYFSNDDTRQEDSDHLMSFKKSTSPLTPDERLAMVKSEYELWKEEGHEHIPKTVTDEQWEQLCLTDSQKARERYLRYLFLTEVKKENDVVKAEARRNFSKARHGEVGHLIDEGTLGIKYGLWLNSYFVKWNPTKMSGIENSRLINASQFGQPIIFDYSYDHYMKDKDKIDLARQITMGHNLNRVHPDPYYMHFCNFNEEDRSSRILLKALPTLYAPHYPIDVHSCSYLDVFPRERLVYLTPDSGQELVSYDPNDIYIIGALVDKGHQDPHSLARAKKEGIRTKKFPLEKYISWGSGDKTLPLNQVMGILLELKYSGSWVKAFQHIPRRKVQRPDHTADIIKSIMNKPRGGGAHTLFNTERRPSRR